MKSQTTTQLDGIRLDPRETREVQGFDRVSLRVQNIESDLVITQGPRESLVIEANPDLLTRITTHVSGGELMIRIAGSWSDFIKEALATSLTRQRIRCTLMVRQLTALEVDGIARVEVANLETDRLVFRFRGPGKANFVSLHARMLEVDISGPCKLEAAGQVVEQTIAIGALGFYFAPKLESKQAVARLNGPGQATIRVSDDLDATISGPGRLEYYGTPRIRRKGNPLGVLVNLGKA
jgi:hypothetical protein